VLLLEGAGRIRDTSICGLSFKMVLRIYSSSGRNLPELFNFRQAQGKVSSATRLGAVDSVGVTSSWISLQYFYRYISKS
jgi:hypothetical protein